MKLSEYIFPSQVIKIEKGGKTTTTTNPSGLRQDIDKLINNLKMGKKEEPKQIQQPVQQPVQPTADPFKGYTRGKVPDEFSQLILKSAQEQGLNPSLLAGILFQESGINPKIQDNISVMESGIKSRDRGMAQISDYWNPNVSDQQAYDPNFAIPYMAKTIKSNLDKTGKLSEAVAAYNVGIGRVGTHPSRPTGLGPKGQQYIQGVSANLDPALAKELGLY